MSWSARPDGWVKGARALASDHHDERSPASTVDLLVIHHISLPPGRFSGDAIERLFTGTLDSGAHPYFAGLAGLRVSAHFLIRRRGELCQFDVLEDRISAIAEADARAALRPDLDGNEVMAHLGLPPGPLVGKAVRHLLELRLENGPLSEADALAALDEWWAANQTAP